MPILTLLIQAMAIHDLILIQIMDTHTTIIYDFPLIQTMIIQITPTQVPIANEHTTRCTYDAFDMY